MLLHLPDGKHAVKVNEVLSRAIVGLLDELMRARPAARRQRPGANGQEQTLLHRPVSSLRVSVTRLRHDHLVDRRGGTHGVVALLHGGPRSQVECLGGRPTPTSKQVSSGDRHLKFHTTTGTTSAVDEARFVRVSLQFRDSPHRA